MSAMTIEQITLNTGLDLFDYQLAFMQAAEESHQRLQPFRACLYYKTGAGKSLTALAAVARLGYKSCVVISPPSTHTQWQALGEQLDIKIATMSHAMFRQKHVKLSRHVPIIADEFHMFGGSRAMGWRKLDRLARHVLAPVILCSATPNYNDAERCYCVQHILDPQSVQGGFLQFLYKYCITHQNPFGMTPLVEGFRNFPDAAAYLASLEHVYHVPDDQVYHINNLPYDVTLPDGLEQYGYDAGTERIIASLMEYRHRVRQIGLIDDDGYLQPRVFNEVQRLIGQANTPVLIFAVHLTVVNALTESFSRIGQEYAVITGDTPKSLKDTILQEFRNGQHPVLIGTASLGTGTDGMDKVCDTLILLDDTDDDAFRRQLIGRILPRGDVSAQSAKHIYRFMPFS